MSPKLISFAVGIVFGCLVYFAVAWGVTRLLSLHDRVHVHDQDEVERGSPPDEISGPSGKGVLL